VNANEVFSQIMGSKIINVTRSLYSKYTLHIPSLTTKLISVSQLVEDLNCVVLMYLNFYIFQNILTKEILGHDMILNRLDCITLKT
jgi:hypothetical protein